MRYSLKRCKDSASRAEMQILVQMSAEQNEFIHFFCRLQPKITPVIYLQFPEAKPIFMLAFPLFPIKRW
jgi:hypothetical protein